jgi:hypothetical protein
VIRWTSIGRGLSLLLACWFVLLRTEPVALHACPMHGAAAHHAHGAVPAMAPAAGGEMVHADAEHTAAHEGSHEDSPSFPGCLCLGSCCAAGAAITVPTVTASFAAAECIEMVARAPQASVAPRAAADRLLPFPNGPPAIG